MTRIDQQTEQAVIEYRNSSTGEVEQQYPSESQLRAYAAAAARPDDGAAHLVAAQT